MIYVNDKLINTTLFPDNTSQVWKLPIEDYGNEVEIRWDYSYEGEVMQLAQLKALLDHYKIRSNLYISYLPYARQDKEISNQTTFALQVFARTLNGMKFEQIMIQDPHSDAALAWIKNSSSVYPIAALNNTVQHTRADLLCYPDHGARIKYRRIFNIYPTTYAEKERDQLTGQIIRLKLEDGCPVLGKSVLIVDDICDGGATFVRLAQELRDKGAKEVNLFVTHGLFSKGLVGLRLGGISNVYTPHGRAQESSGGIIYKKLEEL